MPTLLSIALRSPGAFARSAVLLALVPLGCHSLGVLPESIEPQLPPESREQAAIERQEVCVGSSVVSAGRLADTLYYRAVSTPDGKLAVGYFAFFSEERPWGNNWLTWSLIPALAIDLVYSRALLVAPGWQRLKYGKGDVEGVRVFYDVDAQGALRLDHAVADDGLHQGVVLGRGDALAVDPARPTFYTDVWSHQLGGRGARSFHDLAYVRCYGPGHVRVLTDSIAREFNVEHRARPAHVEGMGVALAGPRGPNELQRRAAVLTPAPLRR